MTHLGEQLARFGRLFAFAFIAQAAVLDWQHLTRAALISATVAAAETAVRQYWRVTKTDKSS